MLVDGHAHVIPGSFPEAAPPGCDPADWPRMSAGDAAGTRLLVSGALRFTARDAWFDAERRLAASAASAVDAEVVSPFPPLLNYRLAPVPAGVTWRAGSTSTSRAWPRRHRGGSTGSARCRCWTPTWPPPNSRPRSGSWAWPGGGRLQRGRPVAGRRAFPRLLRRGRAADGAAIFVHAMPVPSDRLPGPATATFGVGIEGSLAAAAIITGGIAEKYPRLRLAFSHAAGGFPLMLTRAQWFWGRTWNEEPPRPGRPGPEAAPWAAATGPAELARRFYYDSLVFDHRAIRYLLDMIGPDRLLVGSDFPAMPREEPAGRTLRFMGLADEVLDDITWHNCFRFLGLSEPEGRGVAWTEERRRSDEGRRHLKSAPEASGKPGPERAGGARETRVRCADVILI